MTSPAVRGAFPMGSLVVVAFFASVGNVARAEVAQRTRILDKTFVCSPYAQTGVQSFQVDPFSVLSLSRFLVSVGVNQRGQIPYQRERCKPTTPPIPITRGALPGPYPFGDRYVCLLQGRILVRVRQTISGRHHLDRSLLVVRLPRRRTLIALGTTKATGTKDTQGNEAYERRLWVSHRCYKSGR